jgi:hypothetical protein
MKIFLVLCIISYPIFAAEHDDDKKAKDRSSSDAVRALTLPEKGQSLGVSKLPLFRCQSQLSSPFVKDAELECRSGDKKVLLDYTKLMEIEEASKGFVQPACLESGSNRTGAEADKDKLKAIATDSFRKKFFEAALKACKEQFSKEIGVTPENITMIKPTFYYYAKKGEEKAKEYKPEKFSLSCGLVDNVAVINEFN